ncbi:hypothetical protein ScPMuIL_011347 [Solemya velum]
MAGRGDRYHHVTTSSVIVRQGVPKHLTIDVPHNLLKANYRQRYYLLQVHGIGGLVFSDQAALTFEQKSMSIFVQTDKSIYKPGQTVNFRVFCLRPNMSVYTGPMDIWVADPNGNKIKQFLGAQNEYGVITKAIIVDTHPILGNWKINVTVPGSTMIKTFRIGEYVLPKFEVSLELPPYVLTSDDSVTGTIHAKYTFGKPLKGKAVIRANTNYYYNPWRINGDEPMVEHTIDIDGSTQFTLPLARLQELQPYTYRPLAESLNNYELTIDVNVTETMNNMTVNASDSTTFYTEPMKFEFLPSNDRKFKPGLPYRAKLQLSSQDGRPISTVRHDVKVTTYVRYQVQIHSNQWHSSYYNNRALKLSEITQQVPLNGLIEVPVHNTFQNATNIHIKVTYSFIIPLHKSHFMRRLPLGTQCHLKPNVGQDVIFEIQTTESVSTLMYQVMGRGFVVMEGTVDVGGRSTTNLTLPVTSQMAPSAKIIVYYMSGFRVISESDDFAVSGLLQNQVTLGFDRTKAEPGENISLAITADPQSIVNLLAVDQSVLILGSGNDVTQTDITREMDSYNSASNNYYYNSHNNYYEVSPEIFDKTGLAVMTDITTFTKRRSYINGFPYPFDRRNVARQAGCPPCNCNFATGITDQLPGKGTGSGTGGGGAVLQSVKRTRTLFPETWLWTNISTGANGSVTLTTTVPDTITSWIATAFAMNKDSGLGITASPAKLTTFRPFFVNLNLPYSVIRGEHVVIQANVFNYMTTSLDVLVTLAKSGDYQNIIIHPNGTEQHVSRVQTQTVTIAVGEAKSLFFPIITTKVGKIDVSVKAQSSLAADGIRRKLLVKPEGVEKEYNMPVLIDLVNGNNFNTTLQIELPPNIVQGSERTMISAIGDYMGPTVSNLDGLLRMPYGCGEQTMITFAPDVFVANYLEATNQLTPMLLDKILWYLERGYQRELSYQHMDGSFSSFGERDRQGSTWLTAFVVKSFHQAKRYISIDDYVLQRGIGWLIQQQRPDGAFHEPGTVHSQYLRGGVSSEVSLTAFVVTALMENNDTKGFLSPRIAYSVARAVYFIESRINGMADEYVLAISAYALRLAGSQRYTSALTKLNSHAITEGSMKHWHKQIPEPRYYWSAPYTQSRPIDIEITSYALLTYAHLNNYVNGWPLLKWILKQRNNNGGFASTQDTILALQSMSEFAQMGFLVSASDSKNINMQVAMTGTNFSHQVSINSRNALVLQTYQPTNIPSDVTIQATGSGLALVQVGVFFNVERGLIEPSFAVNVTVVEETINKIVVQTCTRYTKTGSSGMAIVELGIPSGFDADEKSVSNATDVIRTEVKEQKLVLYFNQISSNSTCMTVEATRISMVAKAKPVSIQVYDYYQPTDQVVTFYQPQLLRDSNICDVCADCGCPVPSNNFKSRSPIPVGDWTVAIMLRVYLSAFLLVVTTTASPFRDNSYLITAPKLVRPGLPLNVSVNILSASEEVYVRVDLVMSTRDRFHHVTNGHATVVQGTPGHISMMVPHNAPVPDWNSRYTLRVLGIGGLEFTNSVDLQFSKESMSIFVQTDKAIYKPGQTINFRVFCLHPDMSVYKGAVDIRIIDPNGNRIKQILGAQNEYGVVTDSLTMDSHPILGNWKINVTAPGATYIKIFEIGKYVLPKYEVSLELPPYILTTDTEVMCTIKAKYTFGKAVKGTASVKVDINYYNKPWQFNRNEPMVEMTVAVNGDATFSIPLTRLQELEPYSYKPIREMLNNRRLTVDVSLSDDLNNTTMTATESTTFYNNPVKIEFLNTADTKFKPGFNHEETIRISMQDGRPLSGHLKQLQVSVFVQYRVTPYMYKATEISKVNYTIPNNGVLTVPVTNLLPNATRLHLLASYGDSQVTKDLHPYEGSTVSLELLSPNVQVGQHAVFEVRANQNLSLVTYQVVSRGSVKVFKQLDMLDSDTLTISVEITAPMAPTSQMIIYYMTASQHIVSEVLEFDVGGLLQNQVSLTFNTTKAEPGDGINLAITADPQSFVNLLAVDQSVLLLKSGNDITESQVAAAMMSYKPSRGYYYSNSNQYYRMSPKMFDAVGLAVMTDIKSYNNYRNFGRSLKEDPIDRYVRQVCPPCACPGQTPMPPTPPAFMPTAQTLMPPAGQTLIPGTTTTTPQTTKGPSTNLKPVERIRNLFPETWLWTNTTTGVDGMASIITTVPDTITSWVATAFAMNKQSGLGITRSPVKVQTFRPFFVNLNLPYSIIQGEHVVIQANVFNYMAQNLSVRVTLEKSNDFQNILVDNNGAETFGSQVQERTIQINADEVQSVFFPVVAKTIGKIDISVKAQSAVSADGLKRQLLVEPEGVQHEYCIPVMVNLQPGDTMNQTLQIDFPPNTVPGSQRTKLTAIGDYMGTTLSNLERLIRMPTGCGEQIMINFAPDVFIANYLKASNQLTPVLLDKITRYLHKGYQRELSYQHWDGSYSAFGERDNSGSTWLTAFVMKSFCQARNYIAIDDYTMERGINFLLSQQKSNGAFREPGRVVHNFYLTGGSASDVGLTAFVLIALTENANLTGPIQHRIEDSIRNARRFLEANIQTVMTDRYMMAISAYALSLTGSSAYSPLLDRLDSLAISQGGMKHWHKPEPRRRFWASPNQQSKAIDIEMTAYTLLTYTHTSNPIAGWPILYTHTSNPIAGWPILKWIISQRNANGGFASTQDTILSLQAMSEFLSGLTTSPVVGSQELNMQINMASTNFTHGFHVNTRNALVLQGYEPKSLPSEITITASGSGFAIVEVGVFFNAKQQLIQPSFDVNVTIREETINMIVVRVCSRYQLPGSSGMAILELGIPSGFDADEKSVTEAIGIKKTEVKDRQLVLYYDKMDHDLSYCLTLEATRIAMVAKSQPAAVRVYDYYQPTDQVTQFYHSTLLSNSTVCDVCSDCACPKSK